MAFFRPLYDWTLRLSRHRRAPAWLGGLSVAESVIFPIPVDVMLAPMVMARPDQWWRLALLTTLASVLGGMIGYALGYALLDAVLPWIEQAGKREAYDLAVAWFERYGFWAIFLAGGATPIPYKVFTISAGAVQMALLPFILGSLAGRASRFFLVAGLVRLLGPTFERHLLRYIEAIGWVMLALIVGVVIWIQ